MGRLSSSRWGAVVTSLALAASAATLVTPAAGAAPSPQVATQASAPQSARWVSAWSASMQGPATLGSFGIDTISGTLQQKILQAVVPPVPAFHNQTIRQVMNLHYSGNAVRIKLSNQFGNTPARFPSVTIGERQGNAGASVVPGTGHTVTFGGKRAVTIPVGKTVFSDPVSMPVKAFDHVVLSIFVPEGNGAATVHGNSMQTYFVGDGDQTGAIKDAGFGERGFKNTKVADLVPHILGNLTTTGYYASNIEVAASNPKARTLVAFGDSITDGYMATVNADTRYPDLLARRVQANPATRCLSVNNEAISGGRVTGDGIGPSALHREMEEVVQQPNVGGVLFLQGINDFGTAIAQGLPVSAPDLINGYKQFAATAHAHGIKVYMGTLLPSGDLLRPNFYGLYSAPETVIARQQVNNWLQGAGRKYFDGIVDFYNATKDPLDPNWINTFKYDSLDNLHPNDAGYQKMADTVPLNMLAPLCK